MERGEQKTALADQHRLSIVLSEHLDVRAELGHPRGTDEDAVQRALVASEVELGLEARDLAPVGIALDLEVDKPEVLPVEDDHSGAGAEDRRLEGADRAFEPVQVDEAHDRGGLSAGNDEAVEPVELFRQPHFDDVCSESPQDVRVLAERSLNREHTDARRGIHDGNSRDGRWPTRYRPAST